MNGIIQNTVEGMTSPSYSDNTLEFSCKHRELKSISVVNGDAALALTYKIIGYYDKNEKASSNLRSENDLLAGASFSIRENYNQYDHIKVFIKSKTVRLDYYVIQNFK